MPSGALPIKHTLPVLSGIRWERIFSLLAASFHLYNKLPSTTHNSKKQARCKLKTSNFLFRTRPLFSIEGTSRMIKLPSDKSPESMLKRTATILSTSRQRQFRPYSKLENTDHDKYQLQDTPWIAVPVLHKPPPIHSAGFRARAPRIHRRHYHRRRTNSWGPLWLGKTTHIIGVSKPSQLERTR
jgi:hypothetical protein